MNLVPVDREKNINVVVELYKKYINIAKIITAIPIPDTKIFLDLKI